MRRLSTERTICALRALTAAAILVMAAFAGSTCRTMLKQDYRYEVSQERLDQAEADLRSMAAEVGMSTEELEAAIANMKSRYYVKKKEQ